MRTLLLFFPWLIPIITIAILRWEDSFWLSLFNAFGFQWMILLVLLSIFGIIFRMRSFSLACFCGAFLFFLHLPPLFDLSSRGGSADLTVAHFNVLVNNQGYQHTIEAALNSNADLLSFQEVDGEWAKELYQGLRKKYPYHHSMPHDDDAYGLALFSKSPLVKVREFHLAGLPNIEGRVRHKNKNIYFVLTHTRAPTTQRNFQTRNRHIAALAYHLSRISGPKMVIGDFNSVPWDRIIANFTKTAQVFDSRKSLMATYPTFFQLVQIPIDYIFHSWHLECLKLDKITGTSSDHYGIRGTFRFNT